jgi:hypothetical protein
LSPKTNSSSPELPNYGIFLSEGGSLTEIRQYTGRPEKKDILSELAGTASSTPTFETMETYTGRVGYEYTYVNNFKIVGQGSGNNFMIHETLHLTVNPDGTLTAYVDNYSAECN